MLKFDNCEFVDVFGDIRDIAMQMETLKINMGLPMPGEIKNMIRPTLEMAKKRSADLSLDVSVRLIDQITTDLDGEYSALSLKKALDELKGRILHEMEITPVVLRIRREKVDYFQNTAPFGNLVFERFPSASFDIEEASKCFALARYTACVMHLQKVMETGLIAFFRRLRLLGLIEEMGKKKPNWGNFLTPVREEIRERSKNDKDPTKKDKSKKWKSAAQKEFCEDVHPFLEAVRTAWRNSSMHAGSKYDEEVSEHIYSAVKGFMCFLASHLDEKGKFIR